MPKSSDTNMKSAKRKKKSTAKHHGRATTEEQKHRTQIRKTQADNTAEEQPAQPHEDSPRRQRRSTHKEHHHHHKEMKPAATQEDGETPAAAGKRSRDGHRSRKSVAPPKDGGRKRNQTTHRKAEKAVEKSHDRVRAVPAALFNNIPAPPIAAPLPTPIRDKSEVEALPTAPVKLSPPVQRHHLDPVAQSAPAPRPPEPHPPLGGATGTRSEFFGAIPSPRTTEVSLAQRPTTDERGGIIAAGGPFRGSRREPAIRAAAQPSAGSTLPLGDGNTATTSNRVTFGVDAVAATAAEGENVQPFISPQSIYAGAAAGGATGPESVFVGAPALETGTTSATLNMDQPAGGSMVVQRPEVLAAQMGIAPVAGVADVLATDMESAVEEDLLSCDSSRRRKKLTPLSKQHAMSLSAIHSSGVGGKASSPSSIPKEDRPSRGSNSPVSPNAEVTEGNNEANRRLREFSEAVVDMSVHGLVKEFQQKIRLIRPYDAQCQTHKLYEDKNRYSDIFCLDASRVVLRDAEGRPLPGGLDYIHANHVTSEDMRPNFVITQAPMRDTSNDFWHMVWQVQCPLVLMLCDYLENGKPKCWRYLPRKGEVKQFRNITVRNCGGLRHVQNSLIETRVKVSMGDGRPLKVKHFRWTGWPDHGVPTDFQTVFRLLKECRRVENGVPIIHCSAGIGRSGTLVTIEICLSILRSGKQLNVKRCVEAIRRQRALCVQTAQQYLFIFRALLEMAEVNGFVDHQQTKAFRTSYERLTRARIAILK